MLPLVSSTFKKKRHMMNGTANGITSACSYLRMYITKVSSYEHENRQHSGHVGGEEHLGFTGAPSILMSTSVAPQSFKGYSTILSTSVGLPCFSNLSTFALLGNAMAAEIIARVGQAISSHKRALAGKQCARNLSRLCYRQVLRQKRLVHR